MVLLLQSVHVHNVESLLGGTVYCEFVLADYCCGRRWLDSQKNSLSVASPRCFYWKYWRYILLTQPRTESINLLLLVNYSNVIKFGLPHPSLTCTPQTVFEACFSICIRQRGERTARYFPKGSTVLWKHTKITVPRTFVQDCSNSKKYMAKHLNIIMKPHYCKHI